MQPLFFLRVAFTLKIQSKKIGSPGRNFNACRNRFSCKAYHICTGCPSRRTFSYCKYCKACNSVCDLFEPDVCPALSKPPYVCNGALRGVLYVLLKNVYTSLTQLMMSTVPSFLKPVPVFPCLSLK